MGTGMGPGIEDWDGDGNYFEKEHFESSVKNKGQIAVKSDSKKCVT